ncbi:MAG: MFS transporter [Actinobacteria bacterium]|nr:MFS transporter [Actinomycetota bacterium]
MAPLVTQGTVDADELARVLIPRNGLVLERDVGGGRFEAVEGPFRRYERRVTVTDTPDGRHHVTQEVSVELAVRYWRWLFATAFRRRLRRLGPESGDRTPWWAPPDRLDPQAAETLDALALLSVILGYATILLSQTITFAAHEFGAGKPAQGVALAAVRFDLLLSFPVVALTDRRGRRWLVLAATAGACVITAVGAITPSLPVFIATQVPARGLLTAAAVIVAIMAAEEMPAGGRAYALGLLTMAGALGSGVAVMLLPVADLGEGGWRILFAVALVGLFPLAHLRPHLVESRRFRAPHPEATLAGHGGRLWLLAISGLLIAVFFTPANWFLNEYLRDERGFSAARISLFTILTTTPGAIGIVVGGYLADVKGRRVVGVIALVAGVTATMVMFAVNGWPLWASSAIGTILGAAYVPALGVYGPELFPTGLRGRANAAIGVVGRLGSVVGLIAVGIIAGRRSFGAAMTLAGVGPLLLAVLIVVAYPETAHRSLEELNPEDALGDAKRAGENPGPFDNS